MRDDHPSPAPDFKNACIVMFGVNITWIFTAIWAIWGLLVVMVLGAVINHLMTRLHIKAMERADLNRRAPKARAKW